MLEKIFGNDPRVKVISYLLSMKGESLTKKQIALGAEVARSTLNTFFDNLLDLKLIIKDNKLYKLNDKSNLVNILEETQIKLATEVFNEEKENYISKEELTDEELDEIFGEEYEFDINEELDKLENIDSSNTIIPPTEYNGCIVINNLKENIIYEYAGK